MGNASPRSRCGPTRKIYADGEVDRKSTRLNSSHSQISYAVFCLKKKKEHALRRLRQLLGSYLPPSTSTASLSPPLLSPRWRLSRTLCYRRVQPCVVLSHSSQRPR